MIKDIKPVATRTNGDGSPALSSYTASDGKTYYMINNTCVPGEPYRDCAGEYHEAYVTLRSVCAAYDILFPRVYYRRMS